MKPKLIGAVPKHFDCPEHGRYAGAELSIGSDTYASRCPRCREADEELRIQHYCDQVHDILSTIGRATMAKRRKRREGDREFFVRLYDSNSQARVAVGNFWAATESEAVEMAEREFPGLFSNLVTRTWSAQAEMLPAKVTA